MDIRIFRSLDDLPPDFGPCALTIGNFDGVHLGHRTILRLVRQRASANGWRAAAVTFNPHPTQIVAPGRTPALMTTPEQRCALMAEEGIEEVLILPFTTAIAALPADEFVEQILVGRLDARAVIVGHNFRFGHKQRGDTALLAELGARFGFSTGIAEEVALRDWPVSSSAIRAALLEGRVSKAGRMLKRPYWLQGKIVPGHGVGSRQTVPTLNLDPGAAMLPAGGVYITRTLDCADGRAWESITNVGKRPTFDGGETSVETFLLSGFDGRSPASIRVEFLLRLREERRFDSPELLRAQILKDAARARRYFRLRLKWDNKSQSLQVNP